jgi:hypothetical protein
MRIDDFDSQWHFVPDRPEAIRGFRRTNQAMMVFFAVFVLGVFVAMMVSPPVRNSITATHLGSTIVQKAKALAPQHAPAPQPETR